MLEVFWIGSIEISVSALLSGMSAVPIPDNKKNSSTLISVEPIHDDKFK